MRRPPPIVEMEFEELLGIVERAKASLNEQEYRRLKAGIETFAWLTGEIEHKRVSIARLKGLLFGTRSEKTKDVLGEQSPASERSERKGRGEEERTPRTGHGRNGAGAYAGARRVRVPHESLKKGDACPECRKGKVYGLPQPQVIVRVKGTPPLEATVYEKETFRCNLCGKTFPAKSPEGIGEKKYEESAAAMIGLLKYGTGLPFHRLEKLEGSLGIPLPAATQWEIVREAAGEIAPAHEELIREAAQGEILHNDDTPMKVLALEARPAPEQGEEEEEGRERTGVFTSGIVSTREGRRIALFFTGREHAGENLEEVLKRRAAELSPPIQMCDGLSRNEPSGEFDTVLSNCIAHGRRKFVELKAVFPPECRHVIESLREVYRVDARARERGLDPTERLRLHQAESAPVMEELRRWMDERIEEREVEPNSPLGQAIRYMRTRWERLTLFLRVPGAPLDNNLCERALKKAILHRKNALFYKTENGARVGDVFMSLIHSAELAGENPFEYLVALLRHAEEVRREPGSWMPWNFRQALAALPHAPPKGP